MKRREIDPELRAALKRLKLGYLIDILPERLVLATQQQMPFEQMLLLLLNDEISRRDSTATARRAEQAGLEPDMVLERWGSSAKVTFDQRVLNELASLRFVDAARNVVVLGPVGVGKTFLASALGHIACRHGCQVLFRRADQMLKFLQQSRFDNSRDVVMRELCAVDLLIVDEFALEPMERDESRDIYQLFVERNGYRSTIITSNRDTSEWIGMLADVLQAQSAVDRFINAAYDFVIEGESYRPRQKPLVTDDDLPPSHIAASCPRKPRRRRSRGQHRAR